MARSVAVASVVALVAGCLRLIGLASRTPGFRIEEATSALMAQRVNRDNLPVFFGREQDAVSPAFPYMVKVTGTLAGWDVFGPRLAAAICGIAVAVFCALWLGRALGIVWGLAGGLLAATSFWQLMFSRQALAPISTALFASLGLWLAWQGLEHGRRRQPASKLRRSDLRWYIASGAAFGLGFFSHAGFLVVPALILLSVGVLALNQQRTRHDADALGPALLLLTMVVVMTPLASFFLDNPQDFRRHLDLAVGLPEDLVDTGDDVATGLLGLSWEGSERAEVNLPGRPLLDPIVSFWAVIGLLAALRHPTRAFEGTLLVWLVLGVFAISLVGDNDPSLFLPLTPILIALPILGMHAAWRIAGSRDTRLPAVVGVLVMFSVVASGAWSVYGYFWQWTGSAETYEAMRGDVRDAADALEQLPEDGNPVYFATGDAGRIVRYLAPERPRYDIDSRSQLAVAVNDDAYLIAPRSSQPVSQLRSYLAEADMLGSGAGPDGDTAYRIWLVGPRTREALPFAVPAIPFENGWSLLGFDARAAPMLVGEQPDIEIVLLWQVPSDADPFTAVVRLLPPGEQGAGFATRSRVEVEPWKNPPVEGGEYLLVYARLPFPRTSDLLANIQLGLQDPATGRLVTPLLNEQDGYAFLNQIQVVLP